MNEPPASKKPSLPVLFFDGDCALCNASVRFVLRHERTVELRFAALQSAFAREKLKGLDLPDSLVLWLDDQILVKSDAALAVSAMLRGWPAVFRYLKVVPKPIRDFFYDQVARLRKSFFGTSMHCALTHTVDRTRFLDL